MKLLVINGSVRESRATGRVVAWVEKTAKQSLQDVEIAVVDLKEFKLPMFDEPVSPMMNPDRKPEGQVKAWLDELASADGYVFVTPEYNHTMPSGLKNAIDYIDFQVMKKPFLVVGHGGVGGARATQELKLALNANIGAVPVPVAIPVIGYVGYQDLISETGEANTDDVRQLEGTLKTGLETLAWYAEALSAKRAND